MEHQILIQISPEKLTDLISKGVNLNYQEIVKSVKKEEVDIITREETAKLLGVDKSTLWRWTKQGKIMAYGIGNRIYYKRSEIEDSLIPINSKLD